MTVGWVKGLTLVGLSYIQTKTLLKPQSGDSHNDFGFKNIYPRAILKKEIFPVIQWWST